MEVSAAQRLTSALRPGQGPELRDAFKTAMGKENSAPIQHPTMRSGTLLPGDFLLRGDDQFIERGNSGSSVRAPYPGNTGNQFGQALADQLRPTDRTTQALLGRAEKLDIVRNTTEVPPDRFEDGFSPGDVKFQSEVSKLVADGTIRPGAFVISSTGHDMPVMATLLKSLDMSGALHVPDYTDLSMGNGSRVISQAETFGDEIKKNEARNVADGSVGSYFLGIDGHRSDFGESGKFDTSLLPDAASLKAAGVNRIVFLAEARVGPASLEQSEELQPYLEKMKAAGIEVILRGIDPRI